MASQSSEMCHTLRSVCLQLAVVSMLCMLPAVVAHRDIYVDQKNGTDSENCWNGTEPCKTLEWGLKGLQNETTLWLHMGTYYTTHANVSDFRFADMYDIAIVGMASEDANETDIPAVVNCNGSQIGLSFYASSNITLQGIALVGCGAQHISTSRNFTHKNSFEFAKFYATLYFLYSQDVTLQSVQVNDSNGIGAVLYSIVGTNTINSTCFYNNTARDPSWPGGGGLYIEFSYCTPQSLNDTYENCSESNVPEEYRHSAAYTISNSVFENNIASIVNPNDHTFILPHNSTHLAFGRGGGISVFLKGNASNNNVIITKCTIRYNVALWGAGLFVEYQDNTMNNVVSIINSDISDNRVNSSNSSTDGTGGGGTRLGFLFFDTTHSHHNTISFVSVTFDNNTAYFGGGVSFYVARENVSTATNHLSFEDCVWIRNTARVGTAVDLSVWHPVPEGAIVKPTFSNCLFYENNANYATENTNGTFVGLGAMYSDSVPVVFEDYVNFTGNTQTALAAVSTGIYFSGNIEAKFYDNTGRNGGAIALMGYAFIEVSDQASLKFVNNHADLKGGAIYGHSIGEHDLISSRNCFIRYSDIYSIPEDWTATFTFENNTAKKRTNSIFVTSLLTCLWGGAFGSTNTSAQKEVFCWNDEHWEYIDSNCSENIATSPATFVPLNGSTDGVEYKMSVIPGRRQHLPFMTTDDQNNTVTDSTVLIAAVQDTNGSNTSVYLDSSSVYISDNSIEVHGNVDVSASGILKIETIDPRVISTQVHITIQDCPPGMKFESSNSVCTCEYNYNRLLNCFANNYTTQIQRGAWIGKLNNTDREMVVGQTPYIFNSSQYFVLPQDKPLDSATCGQIHRTGILCASCSKGFGPAVNSGDFKCLNCTEYNLHRNWFFYLLTEFLPITIFFLIVVFFNVSVTSGPANAFVFFAQMSTTAMTLDGDGSIQASDVLPGASTADDILRIIPYDFWNLNFFRPWLPEFCLSPNITTLMLLSTGYVTAFYPLILVGIFALVVKLYSSGVKPVVWLCRPVHRCFARISRIWDFQKSIIHALATFLLLSYTKFTLVSFILVTSAELNHGDGSPASQRLYYDGEIEFLSPGHYPFLIPAVVVLLTFVTIPPLFLMVPSFVHFLQRKAWCHVPDLCGGASLSQFLNAFHGCYKDGTGGVDENNKYDYRWFAGLYFILRVVLLGIYAFTHDWVVQSILQQIVCVGALLAFVVLRPYKNDVYNKVDAAFFGILIVLGSLSIQNYYNGVVGIKFKWTFVIQYLLLLCPLVYISVVVLYYLWKRNKTLIKKWYRKCVLKCWKVETEEATQNDDAFFEDAEVAGRFGGGEETTLFTETRTSVQDSENEPLIANEQVPHRSSGSSGGSSHQRSNESYGATAKTPTSDVERFEKFGIGKLETAEGDSNPESDTNSPRKKRKNLFFTH